MKELEFVRVKLVREQSVPYAHEKIGTQTDAIDTMRHYLGEFAQEAVAALYLSCKGNVLKASVLSLGTSEVSIIEPKQVLQPALLCNASGVILLHNHPSGDPTPSAEDFRVTERIHEACKIMGLQLVDHIVVGDSTYFSFKKQGLLGENKN